VQQYAHFLVKYRNTCYITSYNSHSITRLYLLYYSQLIGTNFMGVMGAITPWPKKLQGRCPQVTPKEFCVNFLKP